MKLPNKNALFYQKVVFLQKDLHISKKITTFAADFNLGIKVDYGTIGV